MRLKILTFTLKKSILFIRLMFKRFPQGDLSMRIPKQRSVVRDIDVQDDRKRSVFFDDDGCSILVTFKGDDLDMITSTFKMTLENANAQRPWRDDYASGESKAQICGPYDMSYPSATLTQVFFTVNPDPQWLRPSQTRAFEHFVSDLASSLLHSDQCELVTAIKCVFCASTETTVFELS